MENFIKKAVKIAGGQAELARKVGVRQPAVHRWIKAKTVPAKRVLQVEKITGISRYKLNPEIYGQEREVM